MAPERPAPQAQRFPARRTGFTPARAIETTRAEREGRIPDGN
jgi:hypothetical protein